MDESAASTATVSMHASMSENRSHLQRCAECLFNQPLQLLEYPAKVREGAAGTVRCTSRVTRDRSESPRDDRTATRTALGAQVDHPVGRLDHVQVVLDDDDRIAFVTQPVQHLQKLCDIVKVQSGGRLIEDVRRVRSSAWPVPAKSFTRCASPPDSVVDVLPEPQIRRAPHHSRFAACLRSRALLQEPQRVLHGHLENLGMFLPR